MEFLEQALVVIGVLAALGIFLSCLAAAGTLLYMYFFSKYAEKYEIGEMNEAQRMLLEEESKTEVLDPWKLK